MNHVYLGIIFHQGISQHAVNIQYHHNCEKNLLHFQTAQMRFPHIFHNYQEDSVFYNKHVLGSLKKEEKERKEDKKSK